MQLQCRYLIIDFRFSADYLLSFDQNKRPGSLNIPEISTDDGSDFVLDTDNAKLVSSLRAKIDQQELMWSAEKATLEEFYEVSSQNLREAVKQLKEANASLRQENDGQLQLLQSSRKALGDLRNRYDLGITSWNEERQRLLAVGDQVIDLYT